MHCTVTRIIYDVHYNLKRGMLNSLKHFFFLPFHKFKIAVYSYVSYRVSVYYYIILYMGITTEQEFRFIITILINLMYLAAIEASNKYTEKMTV